jgi:hypothetical protein
VLLLRGQLFRWGCSTRAHQRQAAAYRSLFTHILAPIEAAGGCTRLVVASHGVPCGLAAHVSAVALFSGRVRAERVDANLSSQAEGMARAVQLHRSHALPHDATLFISRHDLTLRAPISTWRCAAAATAAQPLRRDLHSYEAGRAVGGGGGAQPSADQQHPAHFSIGFASRCEAAAWAAYRCVDDVLFVIPAAHLPTLYASLGSMIGMSHNRDGQCGCFAPRLPPALCPGGNRQSSGHDCHNVLTTAGGLGDADLEACWPAPRAAVGERGGSFYDLPRCEEIDEEAPYRGRACARDAKAEGRTAKERRPRGEFGGSLATGTALKARGPGREGGRRGEGVN